VDWKSKSKAAVTPAHSRPSLQNDPQQRPRSGPQRRPADRLPARCSSSASWQKEFPGSPAFGELEGEFGTLVTAVVQFRARLSLASKLSSLSSRSGEGWWAL